MTQVLTTAIDVFFRIIEILILLRVILSWIPINRENKLIVFVNMATEPILSPIRKLIARSSIGKNLMLDFSPILAYLLLGFLRHVLILIINRI
ncbi:MAG: YggT family protein [Clostridiaceae bacterium]|jgi:YggT family protein|nr:YggT family protein [Clostridiaceae bacterium]